MIKVNEIDYGIEMHHGILFGSTEFDNDWGATVRAYPRWVGEVFDSNGKVLAGLKNVSYPFLSMTEMDFAREFDVKACPYKYDFDIAKIAVPINSLVDWEDDLNADDANEYLVSIADSPKCEL